MTTSANHPHRDSAQQLERLSAYLDGELGETERAALEEHLPTCEECRSLLTELRETRALVRAMPAPTLPRSFRVPETGAIPQPLAGPRRSTAASGTAVQRRRNARALQWVGGLVATLGLLLFVGTLLLPFGGVQVPTTSGPLSSGSTTQSTSSTLPRQPTNDLGQPATAGHFPSTATATAVAPATSGGKASNSTETQGNAPPFGPIAGVFLLIGGAVLLLTGTLTFRRRALP